MKGAGGYAFWTFNVVGTWGEFFVALTRLIFPKTGTGHNPCLKHPVRDMAWIKYQNSTNKTKIKTFEDTRNLGNSPR